MPVAHIAWPAILHFSGDHELMFIASQTEWDADTCVHGGHYESNDRLIDSLGMIYSLNQRNNNFLTPQPTGRAASLAEIIALVKAHLSEQGSCCVSKLFAASITEAIEIAFPNRQ